MLWPTASSGTVPRPTAGSTRHHARKAGPRADEFDEPAIGNRQRSGVVGMQRTDAVTAVAIGCEKRGGAFGDLQVYPRRLDPFPQRVGRQYVDRAAGDERHPVHLARMFGADIALANIVGDPLGRALQAGRRSRRRRPIAGSRCRLRRNAKPPTLPGRVEADFAVPSRITNEFDRRRRLAADHAERRHHGAVREQRIGRGPGAEHAQARAHAEAAARAAVAAGIGRPAATTRRPAGIASPRPRSAAPWSRSPQSIVAIALAPSSSGKCAVAARRPFVMDLFLAGARVYAADQIVERGAVDVAGDQLGHDLARARRPSSRPRACGFRRASRPAPAAAH